MELSCKSEYALLALIALADQFHRQRAAPDSPDCGSQQNIPDRYLEQLLATLRRSGLVRSQRGAKGGYLLAREPWQITVLEVMICIEGHDIVASTENKSTRTTEKRVIDTVWQDAYETMRTVLEQTIPSKTFAIAEILSSSQN